jgi:hypothetical protein
LANTADTAARWVEFIAGHPAFPAGERLRAAFRVGKITRLCDCGCNTFDFAVPEDTSVSPLVRTSGYASICEISFEASEAASLERRSVEFIVYADERGHFAGIEIDFCGNSYPVPESLVIHEPPCHVRCSSELAA